MKHFTALLFLGFLILALSVHGQEFSYGFLSGVNLTNIKLIPKLDTGEYDPMISFNANGYLGLRRGKFLGISVEPGFIRKGGIYKSGIIYGVSVSNLKLQINYIQMPVLVSFYLSDKIFISVGPELSFLINAKAKSDNNSFDIRNYYEDTELSGLIGLNYNIFEKVDIGLRYNHGLTYVSTTYLTDTMGFPNENKSREYNQYVQLIIRYKK